MVKRIPLPQSHASQSHFFLSVLFYSLNVTHVTFLFHFPRLWNSVPLWRHPQDGPPLPLNSTSTKAYCRRNGNGGKFQSRQNGSRRKGIGETGVGEMGVGEMGTPHKLSCVSTNPVFRVFVQVRHKPGLSVTEHGLRLEFRL